MYVVYLRLSSSLASGDVMMTDSNGRDMIRRAKNTRTTWKLNVSACVRNFSVLCVCPEPIWALGTMSRVWNCGDILFQAWKSLILPLSAVTAAGGDPSSFNIL